MPFEVFESRGGRFRWLYRADNGPIVTQSDGSYASRSDAERAIETFKGRVTESGTTAGTKPRESFFGLSLKDVLVPVILALVAGGGSYLGAKLGVEGNIKVKAAELAFAGNPTLVDVQSRIEILAGLFPAELKEWQASASNDQTDHLFPNGNSARWAFLQLAIQKVGCADQVAQLWSQLYGPERVYMPPNAPYDTWITAVKPLTPCPTVSDSPVVQSP